jgi:Family of unknown function (DUF5947)
MNRRSGPPLAALRRATRATPPPGAGERCELCATPIAEPHQHLVDLQSRALLCSCRACALLFTDDQAVQRYRTVPDRYQALPDLDGVWDDLPIPVGLAFLFYNSALGRLVALYPGPAGATESSLPLETVAGATTLRPDVEALLLRRDATTTSCFVVPIDACYELVGRLRTLWQGFDGGPAARTAIDDFFATVRERARGPAAARRRPSGLTRRADEVGARRGGKTAGKGALQRDQEDS